MAAENTEEGLRAAHLTDAIGNQDLDAATELRETATKLAAREAELKQQRAELEKTHRRPRAAQRPAAAGS